MCKNSQHSLTINLIASMRKQIYNYLFMEIFLAKQKMIINIFEIFSFKFLNIFFIGRKVN